VLPAEMRDSGTGAYLCGNHLLHLSSTAGKDEPVAEVYVLHYGRKEVSPSPLRTKPKECGYVCMHLSPRNMFVGLGCCMTLN